ncbi:MAG: Rieske 2Fe-2S domain-containing protein [Deltaproteobacteria bacterium]|nr:Rieske 2Fe-2S domain-containing protein [Deltaproteobacteria bacterium]
MAVTIYLSIIFLGLYLLGLAVRKVFLTREARRIKRESRNGARIVARVKEMQPGSVRKFWLVCGKHRIDGFLVNYDGNFHAYVNRCRHMTTPLDFVRYQFFTEDRRHLICLTHGAIYEPDSGLCIEGPCKGLSLYRLPVIMERGEVLVGCPPGDVAVLAD